MLRLFSLLFARFTTVVYLMRHPKVPLWLKPVPVLAVAYVALPHDFLKDTIPVVGFLDDIWVFTIAITAFIVLSNWFVSRGQRKSDKTIATTYEVLDPEQEDEEKQE